MHYYPNIATALDRLLKLEPVRLIQIGAYIGASGTDPLFNLFREYARNRGARQLLQAVLVEPVPRYFRQLVDNTHDLADFVACENVAIGEAFGLRSFYVLKAEAEAAAVRGAIPDWTSQLGSLCKNRVSELWDFYEHAKRPDDGAAIRQYLNENTVEELVLMITLDQLLAKNHMTSFDVLQTDAEGYDFEILKTVDFTRHSPKIINYERVLLRDDGPRARELLAARGYRLWDTYADTLAIRGDYLHLV